MRIYLKKKAPLVRGFFNAIIMKKCSKCKLIKPLEEFVRDRPRVDGRASWCKVCHKLKRRDTIKKQKQFEDFYKII